MGEWKDKEEEEEGSGQSWKNSRQLELVEVS